MSLTSVHLTNAWHETSGGISTFYRALMRAAERRGHRMALIVPASEGHIQDVGAFGRIYHLQAPRAPLSPDYRMLYPNRFLSPNGAIVQILRDERPDVVEICDKYTLQYLGGLLRERRVSKLHHRPTVIGLSCERMDENMAAYLLHGKLGAAFCRIYMKWLYFPMFDHHIVNSHHTAAELALSARGHKIRRGVWLGPMGVDSEAFSPARRSEDKRRSLAERAGLPPDSLILLYAGRLAREKNLLLLIQMMESLNSRGLDRFRLLIAGSGDMREHLEAAASLRVPGRLAFIGHVTDREELADLYANADLFVHPNPREPFGIAPLEAMASGLPLVAPNAGGITIYANQSNAWLTEPTGDAFARAILCALSGPAERAKKIAAGLETAWRFRWDAAADRYLNLYREIHELRLHSRSLPTVEPLFYSTTGDYWGRELPFAPATWPSLLGEQPGQYLNE